MKRSIGCAVMVLVVGSVLVHSAPAQALSRSREAPYDYGCVGRPPCAIKSGPARNGELHSAGHPGPCLLYGPPFVFPCWWDETSTAAVKVTKSLTGGITAYAKVRGIVAPVSTNLLGMRACLGLGYPGGGGYHDYGCRPLSSGKMSTLATNFENVTMDPGSYVLYVSLSGLPGSAFVERISYRTTTRPAA